MSESIEDRLKALPLRAIVAFAARCARRVQPLTSSLPEHGRDAVERAIQVAEGFACGDDLTGAAARAADVAADAWADADAADAAADAARAAANAARAAAWAADADAATAARAADAADAAADAARAAADAAADALDLNRLIALNLGRPGTRGSPIDPSEAGPLGPLWPNGAPDWSLN
jgi:hypothetical protein